MPVPIPLASTYLGDGYMEPFKAAVPPFDQVPTQSTHFDIRLGPYATAVSQKRLDKILF